MGKSPCVGMSPVVAVVIVAVVVCNRKYVQDMRLIVIDEIHLLGDERGPVLEVIVSRTNFIASHTDHKVRVVGLSTALANARDLADWLAIKQVCT